MDILIGWVIVSAFVALIAKQMNRRIFVWFLASLLISPIIAIIALAVVGRPESDDELTKKCPDCAEIVKLEARICKHCGCQLELISINPSRDQKQKYMAAIESGNLKKLNDLISTGGDISYIKNDLLTVAKIYGHTHISNYLQKIK